MKLWQKVFLYTLILVMLAVSMTSILLLKNSFSYALNQKKQSVYSEHEFLVTSFKSMMITERLKDCAGRKETEKIYGEHLWQKYRRQRHYVLQCPE